MNGSAPPRLYLYSEEFAAPGLPASCRVVRLLRVGDFEAKAAVLVLEAPAYAAGYTQLAVLVKGTQTMEHAFRGEAVGVYVLPVEARVGATELDLSGGLQPVLDWGGITTDQTCAKLEQERLSEA